VTRARRARRARLRASRPVAARAASRTRFGASSRRVSVKARREACFAGFAFSRVLFFRLGFGFRLSRVFRASPYREKKNKKIGAFFFLAKCVQSMPKKENISKKKHRRAL
jgi:hypothetical protein